MEIRRGVISSEFQSVVSRPRLKLKAQKSKLLVKVILKLTVKEGGRGSPSADGTTAIVLHFFAGVSINIVIFFLAERSGGEG